MLRLCSFGGRRMTGHRALVEWYWQETFPVTVPYFSATHFTRTSHGLKPVVRDDTLATNCLSHSTSENTVSCGYLHIATLQKKHLFLKSYQTVVLAPNCLALAENGCRLEGMCCLNHQSRIEIWLAEPRHLLPLQFTLSLLIWNFYL